MAKRLVSECDGCGKKVIHGLPGASVDMVRVSGEFLFLGDVLSGESSRPHLPTIPAEFTLLFCPACLLKWVAKWVEKLEGRPPSKIVAGDIFHPGSFGLHPPIVKE